MCDRCGAIFSERQDNWQTFTATNVKRNKSNGRMETITEQLDACPHCATGPLTDTPAPRFAAPDEAKALTTGDAAMDSAVADYRETQAELDKLAANKRSGKAAAKR